MSLDVPTVPSLLFPYTNPSFLIQRADPALSHIFTHIAFDRTLSPTLPPTESPVVAQRNNKPSRTQPNREVDPRNGPLERNGLNSNGEFKDDDDIFHFEGGQ